MGLFPTTHKSLIARVRQGDLVAWEKFYTVYKDIIFHLARCHGLDSRDAEELTQDVFTGLLGKNSEGKTRFRFEPGGPAMFRTWFRRVIRNKLCDHFRKKRPEKPTADTQFAGNDTDSQRPPVKQLVELDRERFERDFRHGWEVTVRDQVLEWLKKEVDPQTYEALIQCKIEGHDVETVAQRFGKKRNAIDQANHRCLKRLREIRAELETEGIGGARPAPRRGTIRKWRKK